MKSFTPVLTASIASLLIVGCADQKSSTGVLLSKEESACYSEYVDLHDDIWKAFIGQSDTGIASKSQYGKQHYEALGGTAGRALPEGCAELLQFSTNCYERYVDRYADLTQAWAVSEQPKALWGQNHYDTYGKTAGRDFPEGGGCSYEYVPKVQLCPGVTSSGYVFRSRAALDAAVNAWSANSEAAASVYGDINTWDVTAISDMSRLFQAQFNFNDDISCWDVSGVTTMALMFDNARAFNQNIGKWDTGNVKNMSGMFTNAYAFNQSIGSWNTSAVTDMSYMFFVAKAFNKSLNSWNTSRVTTMYNMFAFAEAFNRDIGSWNVSRVKNMKTMFNNAIAFNQDLSSWAATSVSNCLYFAAGATAWLTAYGGSLNKTPPLSASLIAAGCGIINT